MAQIAIRGAGTESSCRRDKPEEKISTGISSDIASRARRPIATLFFMAALPGEKSTANKCGARPLI